ncbi:phage putative head morphogenesis protein, SPP1 gp7 family [Paenibacillus algorifonticola]|uniref:Phage putative head morphogenesis protein, SPP1 gp7 family n=1 Tax=Paenibacillus algorifonticola TaxID=684063 RepID=A0A1I2H1T7_9BACL|nr:minor capsid protein [Paenibacillus algorifonticola]SFF22957.1 phage putative head morphogenesis protein, SPP1 gp7 family [Paenibacillus algorifonticola]
MRSADYWSRRMDQLNESMLDKGEDYIKTQNAEYDKAMARIKKETEAWYGRLAKNNGVSMAEARKLLTNNELKEFRWTVDEYIKAGRENAVDQRWLKQLENASAKAHITRLEELQTKLQQEVEVLAGKRQKGSAGALGGIYKDGYYKGIYEVQRGIGKGVPFAGLDSRQIDKVLSKPWAPDGSNFSARIWRDRDKLVAELQTIMTQDLIRGEPSDKLINDFAKRMGVSKRAAETLIRTEAAYFSGQSRLDGYQQTGVERYQFIATLDSRTSQECRGMDSEILPVSEAQAGRNYPPLHVRCRSTTIPYYEDGEEGERTARGGADGKTYSVPGNMSYEDWTAQHAPKDATEPPSTDDPQPQEPPKVIPAEPQQVPQAFVPAKTIRAAEQAAIKDYGFDAADYSGLDLESVNSVNRAMHKAMSDFPAIKGFAKQIKAVDTEDFVAQASLAYTDGKVAASLQVSSRYYKSSEIDDIIKASVEAKHWPVGSTRESLFIHEFGHLLEYSHAMRVMGAWTGVALSVDDAQVIWSRVQKGVLSQAIMLEALESLGIANLPKNITDELSGYANKNSKEFLAEAFAEVVGTEKPRRLSVEVINILRRKLKEAGLL